MIHLCTLATNKYRFLGERLRDKLAQYYRDPYVFHVGTEEEMLGVSWHPVTHANWVTAVNDKFRFMLSIPFDPNDFVYWIDADTNIARDVYQSDIEGELVGAIHPGNGDGLWRFDRVKESFCYVPRDTPYPTTWYMGAFHGGRWSRYSEMLRKLVDIKLANSWINHEPSVNDESISNYYFHYHRPTRSIPAHEFPFIISDKGGHACLRTN